MGHDYLNKNEKRDLYVVCGEGEVQAAIDL